ncbi:MAG: glycosyltransferase family 2 protein [Gemmatimonadota bacterium]
MLRICIPVHNEATTIGVLLWRLRSVFQGFSREYDVTVYDDASTDGTADVLEPYQSVMPLTVLRGPKHVGYAGGIDALVRHVAADDEYARRDAMVLLQGDFTESPEHLPELVKRFEGGADLVAVHRITSDATPADERRLRRWGKWAVSPFLRMPPVADPFTGFRLVRISVLRDLLKAMGNRPVCAGDGWAANIDFALNVTPFARRIENVEFAPRYDVRQRASRRRGWADVVALFHWARSARGTVRPAPGNKPSLDQPTRGDALVLGVPAERARPSPPERERGGRPERSRPPRERTEGRTDAVGRESRAASEEAEVATEATRDTRPPREGRNAREERALRGEERAPRAERPPREPREPRPPRPPKPERPARVKPPVKQERAVAPATDDDSPYADYAPLPIEAEELDTEATEVSEGGATPAGEKKRRRRRRSRKDRGARAGDGSSPASAGSGDDVESDGDDFAGTSGAGEGEQEDGSDDVDSVEADASAESGASDARRKRRPRRRRRGRRPGGTEAGGPDGESPAPPAHEPPPAA